MSIKISVFVLCEQISSELLFFSTLLCLLSTKLLYNVEKTAREVINLVSDGSSFQSIFFSDNL